MKTNTDGRFRPSGLARLTAAGLLILEASIGFAQNDKSRYAELAKAPEKARIRRNPFEGNAEAVSSGRKLFEQHCAECHGKNGEGPGRGPVLRAEEVRQASPGALFWVLTNGVVRRGMPVWSKLPEPQRWQIVTYIESLQASAELPASAPVQ